MFFISKCLQIFFYLKCIFFYLKYFLNIFSIYEMNENPGLKEEKKIEVFIKKGSKLDPLFLTNTL